MSRGFGGMPPNMNQLMKQAQKMQKQVEQAQLDLADKTLEVTAGGGVIKVVVTGKKEIKDIIIDPAAVDPDDVEMLQDLLLSAINEALRQADEMANKELGKLMPAGMGGMGMPF
jgi:hypothetical protein